MTFSRKALGVAAALAVAVMVIATPLGANAASKSTILIGTIFTAGTPNLNEVGPDASLLAGIRAINKRGGVNGHPLKLVSCNDQGDPNLSESCARKMVHDHVVATIGDVSAGNADAIVSILNAAHIPQIGEESDNAEYTCGTCFPLGPGTYGYIGGVLDYFRQAHLTKVYLVGANLTGLTQDTSPDAVKAAHSLGLQVMGTSLQPPNVADWSPIAAQIASSGAQAVWTFLVGADGVNLVKALQNVGFKGKIGVDAEYTPAELHELGLQSNGQVVSFSPTAPLTASSQIPAVARFQKQLQAEHAAGNADAAPGNLDLVSVADWSVLYAFADIVKRLKTVTTATTLKALEGQKTPVSLQEIFPGKWTPGKRSGVPYPLEKSGPFVGYPLVLKNNAWYLTGTKPETLTATLKAILG